MELLYELTEMAYRYLIQNCVILISRVCTLTKAAGDPARNPLIA